MTVWFLGFTGESYAAIEITTTDSPVLELVALVLGGVGIFLTGIHFAGSFLHKTAGGKFHHLVSQISEKGLGQFFSGLFLGVFTQSGKAAAFILSDFVHADMIKPRFCAPVVFWANAGTSLIVFASMLSVKVLALLILGVTALGTAFNMPKRLLNAYGAIFGLAMVMYGLYLVKAGAAGFAGYKEVQDALASVGGYTVLAFFAGVILTLLVQSNLAIMMIAIALAGGGFLSLEQTAMTMYGAQTGTGILTYIFSSHSHGRARQVVGYQISFDLIATVIFVILFYIEYLYRLPLVMALSKSLSDSLATQAVILALFFQFASAVFALSLSSRIFRYVEDRFPPSASEVLAVTKYLRKSVADSPETGLIMAEKEQFRLFRRLPRYIEYVRSGSTKDTHSPAVYHAAFQDIAKRISEVLTEISGQGLNQTSSDHLIKITKIQEQLNSLEDTIYRLTEKLASYEQGGKAAELGRNIMESVDFIILAAIDALDSQSGSELDTLEMFTQDRSEMMTRVRRNFFNSEQELSRDERNFVLDITILFENSVQSLARYGTILKAS